MPEQRTSESSPYEELARGALLEITSAGSIGAFAGQVDEGDGAVSVLFDSAMAGYPDWKWTVSIAHLDGEDPSVLEAELMPAEGALLAPDWVPWSDRLADYKAAQAAAGAVDGDDVADESADPDDDDDDDDDDDHDDDDDDDDDDDGDDDDDDDDDGFDVDPGDDEDDEFDGNEREKSY